VIVRDGWTFIIIGLVLTILLALGAVRWSSLTLLILAAVFGVFSLFTAFFFRNPPRTVPTDPSVLVSPADGRVVAIVSLDDHPHIGGKATRVSIFLSVLDVHVNRVPAAGVIDYVRYTPGQFMAAFHDSASDMNERTEIGMTTAAGHRIAYSQIAGVIARRIVCNLETGQTVTKGERFGMIRFGSRTDLIVPGNWEIAVSLGNHVKGGETVIGYVPPETAPGASSDTPMEDRTVE
jgi:phosphatidylserine decarboxylase